MAKRSLKILLIFDLPEKDDERLNFARLLRENPDYLDERNVYRALLDLDHKVELLGVYDDTIGIMKKLTEEKYDLIFTMCESFKNDRINAPNMVSLFELLNVRYTGADSQALSLCRDKGLTKKILKYHEIPVPEFVTISKGQRPPRELAKIPYPAIVKPLNLEASEGISLASVVNSPKEAKQRISHLHKTLKADAIVEQFIPGRELYVGVLGNKQLRTFPPRELHIRHRTQNQPLLATYRAKWDEKYRKKLGVSNQIARHISPKTRQEIDKMCKQIYRVFALKGYARIDLRLTNAGKIYFLEANPNPAIARTDDFASSARLAGMSYEELIDQIVRLGVAA